ncbi:MAG: hypothetical protein JNK45_12040 [Myxococcales bacterium]|nr:hypothetical protein [Myxococcales bacterium]
MRLALLPLALVLALPMFGCNKAPTTAPPATPDPAVDAPAPEGDPKPGLTASACEAQGGKVVGDIGDGAVHRPEYRCPDSGEAPIGSIVADPGGPVAIEGAVCCK